MQKCAHCGSANTNTQADKYHCLNCGEDTSYSTGKVEPEHRPDTTHMSPPLVQEFAPFGSPAGSARTPDGVADPGTNMSGPVPKNQAEAVETGEMRDDDLMKGLPEPPPVRKDERPVSMQTGERVEIEEPGPDVHVHGGFTV